MKILIISPFENSASGRGNRNMLLESELRARGHKVIFITGDFDHGKKVHFSKEELPQRHNMRVIHLPGYRKNIGLARLWCHLVCGLKVLVSAFKTRWDVVVVSSIPPEILMAACLLRKRALIIDIRDIWPDALLAYGKPSLKSQLFGAYCNFIYRNTLKIADRIIVVAPGFRRWLGRYKVVANSRVKFVPLGFRREDFRPLSDYSGVYDFCYAGGATPQFDIREFKKEFGNQNGIVLGDGPLLNEWKKAFPSTTFPGVVPRSEAIDLMSKSRKLLFPSNPFAQLPNKAFDYFALGRPVAFGDHCSRATRYLLSLRRRRTTSGNDHWEDYSSLEKEALTKRAADIIEEVLS